MNETSIIEALLEAHRKVEASHAQAIADFEAQGYLVWTCDCGKYGRVTLEMAEELARYIAPAWLTCECGEAVEVYRLPPMAPLSFRRDASIALSGNAADGGAE